MKASELVKEVTTYEFDASKIKVGDFYKIKNVKTNKSSVYCMVIFVASDFIKLKTIKTNYEFDIATKNYQDYELTKMKLVEDTEGDNVTLKPIIFSSHVKMDDIKVGYREFLRRYPMSAKQECENKTEVYAQMLRDRLKASGLGDIEVIVTD